MMPMAPVADRELMMNSTPMAGGSEIGQAGSSEEKTETSSLLAFTDDGNVYHNVVYSHIKSTKIRLVATAKLLVVKVLVRDSSLNGQELTATIVGERGEHIEGETLCQASDRHTGATVHDQTACFKLQLGPAAQSSKHGDRMFCLKVQPSDPKRRSPAYTCISKPFVAVAKVRKRQWLEELTTNPGPSRPSCAPRSGPPSMPFMPVVTVAAQRGCAPGMQALAVPPCASNTYVAHPEEGLARPPAHLMGMAPGPQPTVAAINGGEVEKKWADMFQALKHQYDVENTQLRDQNHQLREQVKALLNKVESMQADMGNMQSVFRRVIHLEQQDHEAMDALQCLYAT